MLEVKNLVCGYNNKFILKNINFELKNKEILGIIGPNGSGKTTLLRAISKIIKQQAGQIIFEGKDIKKTGLNELAKKMAVVTQFSVASESYFNMTAEEIVQLGRTPFHSRLQFSETKQDEKIVEHAMLLTETFNLRNRPILELSGGERQLVFIARAIVQQPKLLVLDEPTAHLDIAHQIRILDLTKKLNTDFGLTVMVVLHDLNLASEYCDRIMLLNNGNIRKIGIPSEVLTYQIIEDVYKTVVVVEKNPISKKPYIILVSEADRTGNPVIDLRYTEG